MIAFTPEGAFLFGNAAMDRSDAADALRAYMADQSSVKFRRSALRRAKPVPFRFDGGQGQINAALRRMLPDMTQPALLVHLLRADRPWTLGQTFADDLPTAREAGSAVMPPPAADVSALQNGLAELRMLVASQSNEEAATIAAGLARNAATVGAQADSAFLRSITLRLRDGLPLDAQQCDKLRTLWSQALAR
jgi:hypothetical protein